MEDGKNKEWIEKAKFLSTQARDKAIHYEHSTLGFNYRMSNVSAAIGRGQLEVLDQRVGRKRDIYHQYKQGLGGLFEFLAENEGYLSNRWLSTALFKGQHSQPKHVQEELERYNIESRPLWKPMHLQPLYKDYPVYGGQISSSLFETGICLPSGTAMSSSEIDFIIDRIHEHKLS